MSETSTPTVSTSKLGREDWIVAATTALGIYGVEGVRVEKLAKSLNVTKGSFYWHFKDRDELLDAVLQHWRRKNTVDILEYLGSTEDPRTRIEKLVRMPFEIDPEGDPLSLSLRLWARHDERPRKVLKEVDDLRVRMKSQLFKACGFNSSDADARAVLLYSYMRVAITLVDPADRGVQEICESLLLPR